MTQVEPWFGVFNSMSGEVTRTTGATHTHSLRQTNRSQCDHANKSKHKKRAQKNRNKEAKDEVQILGMEGPESKEKRRKTQCTAK